MMPAAKHLDPVVGVDIHIILIPSPAGPIPTPLPHPFVGIIMDPFDYAPIIGATVFVGPMPRAQAGTAGIAMPPHIPMGGPFAKPPGNECEMFMGSTIVEVDGDAFSYLALPALSCHDIGMVPPFRPKKPKKTYSLVLPTSVVLPIPAGPPVLIGGPPTISLMALGMRIGLGALGKGFKKLRKLQKGSKRMANFSKKIKAKAKKAMDALGIPSNTQNKVNRALCKVTGHPVDVATGKVFTDLIDFELSGPIKFLWERVWFSTSTYCGPLGYGWHNNFDMELFVTEDVALLRLGDGRVTHFLNPSSGLSRNLQEQLTLSVMDSEYVVTTEVGMQYHFAQNVHVLESGTRQDGLPLSKIQDRNQRAIQFGYREGMLAEIVDSAARKLTVQHDSHGRISSVDGPHPDDADRRVELVAYQYDQDGNLVKATDACGNSYSYEYKDHLLIRETDPNEVSFFFEYDVSDQHSRCVRTFGDGNILERQISYDDAVGQTSVTDSKGNLTVYEWDDRGVVTLTIDPLGNEHKKEYDEDCRLISETNPSGHTTQYTYGEDGRVSEIQEPDGGITRFQYGEHGELLTVESPDGLLVNRHYNGSGNLTGVSFPDDTTWKFTVNQAGERICTTDPEGRSVTVAWGDQGELVSAIDGEGVIYSATYDGWGRPIKANSGCRGDLEYRWDLVGNLLGTRDANGRVHAFQHDRNCNLIAAKKPDGNIFKYSYGPLGRVIQAEFPTGAKIELFYDKELNVKSICDPGGRNFVLERDKNGKVICESMPDGRVVHYSYNQAGHLCRRSDSAGRFTQWEYDNMGRVVLRNFSDGTEESFEYDMRSRVSKAKNASVKVERSYDIQGNILAESINEVTTKNVYDKIGNRTKRESPFGHQIQFQYDKRDRRREISMPCGTMVNSKYDGNDREIARYVPGGIKRSCKFDSSGKLLDCTVKLGERAFSSRSYEYDQVGNVAKVDQGQRGKYRYHYDADGKLLKAVSPSGETNRYPRDEAGNMANAPSVLGDGVSHSVSNDGRWKLIFDMAGQLICKAASNYEFQFYYSAKAELMKVEKFRTNGEFTSLKEPLWTAEFEYDAWGRRISKTICDSSGNTDRYMYVWDHLTLLGEVSERRDSGGISIKEEKEYFLDPDTFEPILIFEGGRTFLPDCGLASEPLAVYTTDAEQVWAVDELPSKNLDTHSFVLEVPFRYAGQFHDPEIELSYNWHRYYDSDLQIYTTIDPLGLEAGLHFWNYVDNPLTSIDPFGLVHETKPNYDVYALYDPPGPPPAPGAKPYYVGITDNQTRRAGEHAKSGRLDKKGNGFMHPLDEGVDYGTARGYEQAYIEKYETRDTSARGKEMSKKTRGNRCNSFDIDNTTRRAERQTHFATARDQKLKQLSPCS